MVRQEPGQLESRDETLIEPLIEPFSAVAGTAVAPIRPAEIAAAPMTTAILRTKLFMFSPTTYAERAHGWPASVSL